MTHFLFWFIYRPSLFLVNLLFFWLPLVRIRQAFEAKNKTEELARSFSEAQVKADLCFEFSSEGEYQQVASLIDDGLKAGLKFELVFFSSSVEKVVLDLAEKFPRQIRYLRYPLLSLTRKSSFMKWVTASSLVLVRYDFFPEFYLWATRPGNKLKIVWVSFKKERVLESRPSFMKTLFLRKASELVFATKVDQEYARKIGVTGGIYDFRMEQIRRRVSKREEKFERVFPSYVNLSTLIQKFPRNRRLIFANSWPTDLFLLEKLPKDFLIVVVPHRLEAEIIAEFSIALTKLGRTPVEVKADSMIPESADTIILNMKGVLCELYADFGKSYVGGGFGASIHSILEPLISGSEQIACGPKHFRSTEYDHGVALGEILEVHDPQEFKRWLESRPLEKRRTRLESIFTHYPVASKEVLSC